MDFTYDELKMIKRALLGEIIRRESNLNTNTKIQRLQQFESLYDKVRILIENAKSN